MTRDLPPVKYRLVLEGPPEACAKTGQLLETELGTFNSKMHRGQLGSLGSAAQVMSTLGYRLNLLPLEWLNPATAILTIDTNIPIRLEDGIDPIVLGFKKLGPMTITRLDGEREVVIG